MPTLSWQTTYDNKEPKSTTDVERERTLELRWLLEIESEDHYTLEELEDMLDEWYEARDEE